MFNHVMLGSNDIQRSRRFYDAVLGVLGVGQPMVHQNATGQTRLFYRHDGNTFGVCEPINGEPATSANGSRLPCSAMVGGTAWAAQRGSIAVSIAVASTPARAA